MAYNLEIQRDRCGAICALTVTQDGTRNVWGVDHPDDIDSAIACARDIACSDPFDSKIPDDRFILAAIIGEEAE